MSTNPARVTRRRFVRDSGSNAAALALAGGLLSSDEPRAATRPHVVFILADDMGYGDLACQNPESKIPTPHLDRLAREGTRFTDAHSSAAGGRASRYGILTGRYPWRAKLKQGVQRCWHVPVVEPDRPTVGKLLQQHGFDTACIGKWYLGLEWPTRDGKPPICVGRTRTVDRRTNIDFSRPLAHGPTARGFDYFFGVDATHFPPYCFIENERTVGIPEQPRSGLPGCPGPMVEGWRAEEILPGLMRKAVAYIDAKGGRTESDVFRQTRGQPFFLFLPLTAPRTPIAPSAAFQGKSRAGAYGDFVCQVDHVVGQVLEALERNGFGGETLVIFTSDNGSPGRDGKNMLGAINKVREYGHDPSYPWRGIKHDIWEGGHRVPFLARWPGHVPPAATCDETICHVDWMATVAALIGEKLPEGAGEDSCNILPALRGEKRDGAIRSATVHCSGSGVLAIRRRQWKLIPHLGSGGWSKPARVPPVPDGPQGQLYDLHADPGETRNLWLERPKVVEALTALLDEQRRGVR